MPIKAAIFDFNGVVIDDEELHFEAFRRVVEKEGFGLTWDQYEEHYLSYDDPTFFRTFFERNSRSITPVQTTELVDRKGVVYLSMLSTGIPVIEGTRQFICGLPPLLPIAIASAALRNEIEYVLREVLLLDRFSVITAAEDVQNSKPDPESFLTTFQRLQSAGNALEPEEIVVFEDSYKGISAAKGAGMKTVAITTSYEESQLQEADLIVDDLSGWNIRRVEAAVNASPDQKHRQSET